MNDFEQQPPLLPDRKAYKQTKWAALIDASIKYVANIALENGGDVPSELQPLADWTTWMVKDGYHLSDEEIRNKALELGLNNYDLLRNN